MSGPRWRIAPEVRLAAWEDGYTVFHTPSGDTHLLDPFAGQVLSCLQNGPMGLEALALALMDRPLAALGSDERAAMETALAALERVHLVLVSP